jgi:hypothetical protein
MMLTVAAGKILPAAAGGTKALWIAFLRRSS